MLRSVLNDPGLVRERIPHSVMVDFLFFLDSPSFPADAQSNHVLGQLHSLYPDATRVASDPSFDGTRSVTFQPLSPGVEALLRRGPNISSSIDMFFDVCNSTPDLAKTSSGLSRLLCAVISDAERGWNFEVIVGALARFKPNWPEVIDSLLQSTELFLSSVRCFSAFTEVHRNSMVCSLSRLNIPHFLSRSAQGTNLPYSSLFREWGNLDSQCLAIQSMLPIGGDLVCLFDPPAPVSPTPLVAFTAMTPEERSSRVLHEWILVDIIDLLTWTGDKEVYVGLRSVIPQLLQRRPDLQQSGLFQGQHLLLPLLISLSAPPSPDWQQLWSTASKCIIHWVCKAICRQPDFQRRVAQASTAIRSQVQQIMDRPLRLHIDRDSLTRPAIQALERQVAIRADEFGTGSFIDSIARFVRDANLISVSKRLQELPQADRERVPVLSLPLELASLLVRCAMMIPSTPAPVMQELTKLQQFLVAQNASLSGLFPTVQTNPKEIEEDANKLLQSIYYDQLRVPDAVKLWTQFVVISLFVRAASNFSLMFLFASDGRPQALLAKLRC